MKKLYFELPCGASGDMILASLIDLGFPLDYLNEQLSKLSIESINIGLERVVRNGISCNHIKPQWQQAHQYRHLGQILDIIKKGNFSDTVYGRCEQVLNRLADAEAHVHGIPREQVHFHEIGAVDTIIDILGASLGIEYLGVEQIGFSSLTVGHGTIEIAHGTIPVPVPATVHLIQGFSLRTLDIPTEILTPTGAAILTTLGVQKESYSQGKLLKAGYGCGTKVFEIYPNMIRAFLFEDDSNEFSTDFVYVIESDMDHITGEIMGHVGQKILNSGALDISWTPVFMKKCRPGYRLTVLSAQSELQSLIDLIMIHTRTLGVRFHKANRVIAMRKTGNLEFLGHTVAEKHCLYKEYTFSKAEYESLNEIAEKDEIPLMELMEKYVEEKIRNSK